MTDAGLTGTVADAAAGNSDASQGQPSGETTQQNGDGQNGNNPAWDELLSVLPSQLVPMVTPHLQKWDKSVNDRFSTITEPYKPWDGLVQGGYDPAMVQGLLQLIENDPQQLITSLQEFHNLTPAQQQQVQGQNAADVLDLDQIEPQQEFDITQIPEFQQLQQQNQQLLQYVQGQSQKEIQDRANAEIDSELKALHDKHGNFDEKALFAFAQAVPNLQSLDQAYEQMDLYNQSILQNRPNNSAPPVLAPTGGAPSGEAVNVAQLGPRDRKSLVTDILRRAAQGQG